MFSQHIIGAAGCAAILVITALCASNYIIFVRLKKQDALRIKLEKRNGSLSDLQNKAKTLKSELNVLTRRRQTLTENVARIAARYKNTSELDRLVPAIEDKIHNAELQLTSLTEQFEEQSKALEYKEAEVAARHRIIDKSSDLVSSLERRALELQSQINSLEIEFEAQNAALYGQYEQLAATLRDREAEIATRHSIVSNSSDLILCLEKRTTELQSKFEFLAIEFDARSLTLHNQFEQRAKTLKDREAEIAARHSIIDVSSDLVTALERRTVELRLEINERTSKSESDIRDLEIASDKRKNDLISDLAVFQADVERCRQELQLEMRHVESTREDLIRRSELDHARIAREAREATDRAVSAIRAEEDIIKANYSDTVSSDGLLQYIKQQLKEIGQEHERLENAIVLKQSNLSLLEIKLLELREELDLQEVGVYQPHYDFRTPAGYRSAIENVRSIQKSMIARRDAVICKNDWTMNGSSSQGRIMIDKAIKLTLRAFNGEADVAIANARWNNVEVMASRIMKAKDRIDSLNTSYGITITNEYKDAKLKELYLTHEHRESIKAEKDLQAEERRIAREEERLLRDLEVAEEGESRIKKSIEMAQAEFAAASKRSDADARQAILLERISNLESELSAAQKKVERAQALAEKTKSGYVYVISNIGSFGKDIIKIGLTRRLDPMDRVRELGDASVPFTFDTHAMIYSDDAPSLERALHGEFDGNRVNTQNARKEFFRVAVGEVEAAVKRLAPEADFYPDIEAQEYHESLARRHSTLEEALVDAA